MPLSNLRKFLPVKKSFFRQFHFVLLTTSLLCSLNLDSYLTMNLFLKSKTKSFVYLLKQKMVEWMGYLSQYKFFIQRNAQSKIVKPKYWFRTSEVKQWKCGWALNHLRGFLCVWRTQNLKILEFAEWKYCDLISFIVFV